MVPLKIHTYSISRCLLQQEKILPFCSIATSETKILHNPSSLLVDENTSAFFLVSLKKLAPLYVTSFNRCVLSSLRVLQLLCSAIGKLSSLFFPPSYDHSGFFVHTILFFHRFTIKAFLFSDFLSFGHQNYDFSSKDYF
jgi:hypothetical protein